MTRKNGPLRRPETHDKRPGMGTHAEMWRYRLAQRVRGLRLLYHADWGMELSQHALAQRLKISQSVISRVEAGHGCTVDVIVDLARFFGVTPDFLLGFDKVPTSDHEVVEQAHQRIMSLASALDFLEDPENLNLKVLMDYRDMLRRTQTDLVALSFKLRYPDFDNAGTRLRVPYGYEFVEHMEAVLGEEIDQ